MFRNYKISHRFVGATVGISILVVAATVVTSYEYARGILFTAEHRELEEVYESVQSTIADKGTAAQTLSALVAGIPQVQEAFAAGDRETLQSYFVPGFSGLQAQYGVVQFQFHLPPATSFLRVHKPAKFGDDLSSFRHTVVETNNTRRPISGMEIGVAGLGVRGMVPVEYQGQHVGSVEFGMSFGQSFFDDYKKAHDVDMALFLDRDGKLEVFASTLGENSQLLSDEQFNAARQAGVFDRSELNDTPVAVYGNLVRDYSGKPIGVLQVVKDRSLYKAELGNLQLVTAGIGFFALLLIGGFVWMISQSVVGPLKDTVRHMEEIASGEGDLSVRLDASGNDEISMLAAAFNRFEEKLERLVKQVSAAAHSLGGMAVEFAQLAEHTNAGVRSQQDETSQVATAMTEMSSTVKEVAESTERSAEAAREADGKANEGNAVVCEAMRSIESLAAEFGTAVTNIQRVESDSDRIGTVLDVIRGIAEQTNLLALNAAIEAARAGDQGRGFAVVADEVRSLAQRTQQSTEEIQDMIESLQSGVRGTVGIMERSQGKVSESVEEASKAQAALSGITQALDTITRMGTQIAAASREQSSVADEIDRNITNIAHQADQTALDSQKSSEASSRLASQVEEIVGLMGQFRVSGS